jgi:hypothetical protein
VVGGIIIVSGGALFFLRAVSTRSARWRTRIRCPAPRLGLQSFAIDAVLTTVPPEPRLLPALWG